jgi:hypothetical protein
VTTDAQISDRLQKESPDFRSMGVMTPHATFFFDGRMDTRTFRRLIVALITESVTVFHKDQLVGFAVVIVARFAIHFLNRGMNDLLSGNFLRPFSVTIATFSCRGWRRRQQR